MRLAWEPRGWDDYLYWQQADKAVLRKINELLRDCLRTPFAGKGKPEPLRHEFSGFWSRRITDEHRLIYLVEKEQIVIAQCRYHYQK